MICDICLRPFRSRPGRGRTCVHCAMKLVLADEEGDPSPPVPEPRVAWHDETDDVASGGDA